MRERGYTTAERVTWDEFLSRFCWFQGEHITIIGPTGTGKTTLALSLIHKRSAVVAFASKAKDDTMDRLAQSGYRLMEGFAPSVFSHIVLQPPVRSARDQANQAQVFHDAIYSILRSGGWCTLWDEAAYLADDLGLTAAMRTLWQQGRSLGVSIIACTQRPAFVPVTAYSSATHLFFFRDNDEVNLSRIGGLGGIAAGPIREQVARLEGHSILYVNTRTGERLETEVN